MRQKALSFCNDWLCKSILLRFQLSKNLGLLNLKFFVGGTTQMVNVYGFNDLDLLDQAILFVILRLLGIVKVIRYKAKQWVRLVSA